MNGRVYDYNLARFTSVDPFVHGGSQGINPYSYILNNPLAGTDPTAYTPEAANTESERKLVATTTGSRIKRTLTVTVSESSGAVNVSGGSANSVAGAMNSIADGIQETISNLSADIGSQQNVAQVDNSLSDPPNAERREQMPELLNDFISGRVSFPQGMDNEGAQATMDEINEQAANYFGLAGTLESDAGWVARTAIGEFNRMRQPYVEAMAWVIRNRVESKRFPNTYKEVVLQRKQFSSWNTNDPNYDRVVNPDTANEWFKETMRTVRKVLNAPSSSNPLPNVTHYYSPRSMEGGRTPDWAVDKNTVNYKDIKPNYMTLVED